MSHSTAKPRVPTAMPGPDDVTRVVFDNGFTLLVRENHAAPVAVAEGYLPTGAIHDPRGKIGVASFTASMLNRGSAGYDFDTVNELIEGVGASLLCNADDHATSVSLNSLSEDFPTLLTLLADLVRRPVFPEAQVQRLRNRRLVHIQERDDDTLSSALVAFAQEIFGDHPYGHPVIGYADTVAAITRDDLLAYHAARYTPHGAILTVVGDVDTPRVIEMIESLFGDWRGPQPDQSVPPLAPLTAPSSRHIALAGKVQADIAVGNRSVGRHHPDYFPLVVANTILGRFGMMGRLGEVVREEMGLAYYASSVVDAGPVSGAWHALAGVNPAHVNDALDAMRGELWRLAAEPVAAEELADSQAYLTGSLPLQLETNDGVAYTLLHMEWFGLGLDYLYRYNDLIRGVTVEDVQRVARTYLDPDTQVTVVAGPPRE